MFSPTCEGLWLAEPMRDGNGRIVDFVVSVHEGNAIGRRWGEIDPGIFETEAFARCCLVMETGQADAFTVRIQDEAGDLWFSVRACVAGTNLMVCVSDVTGHKHTERALRTSQDLLRIAGRTGRLGAWSVELPERRITWSEEVFRIHEVPITFDPNLDQAVEFYTPESQSVIRAAVDRCITEGAPFDLKLQLITAKGRRLWVRAIGQAEYEDNRIKRAFGTFQDITESREAARALEENQRLLTLALSGAEMCISDWHIPSGRIHFDENWCRQLGYEPDEVQPTLEFWESLIPPEDHPAITAAQQRYFEGRAPVFEVEYRMRAKDGSLHWVLERTKIAERDEAGKPVRLSGILHDITDRKEIEERLHRAIETEKELTRQARATERAKSEFLAVMSHEIRTPMNGVLGFADLLAQTHLDTQQCDYVHTIRRSGESLLRIIDDILDYSRLEAGRLRIENMPFSLRQTVANAVDLMSPAAHHKGLLLETKISEDLPDRFEGAPDRLQQVLVNLVGNAIKFTSRGGITIEVRRPQAEGPCEFCVRDTGIGITPSQIHRIFEPFMQAETSQFRRYGGTGLGLAISQRFIDLMGGALGVDSVPGAGSNFHFSLPLVEITDELPVIALENPTAAGANFATVHPLSILLAEDDAVNRKLMVKLLRRLGYSILVAGDGREVLDIFQSHRPDCILMDLHMPGVDGLEATRQIRNQECNGSSTFIAALTADVVPEERQRCLDAGMDDFLCKPLKQDMLAGTLIRASEKR